MSPSAATIPAAQIPAAAAAAFNELMRPMTLYSVIDVRDDDSSKYVVDLMGDRRGSVVQRSSMTSLPGAGSTTSLPGAASSWPSGPGAATPPNVARGDSDSFGDVAKRSNSSGDNNSGSSDNNSEKTVPSAAGGTSLLNSGSKDGNGIPAVPGPSVGSPVRGIGSPLNGLNNSVSASGGSVPTTLGRACDLAQEMVQCAYDGQVDRMDGFFDAAVRDCGALIPEEERELLTAMHDFAGSILRSMKG
jgi:hypothetical protein